VVLESRRIGRLGDQIQEEVSDIIRRKIKDPRVGFVSVTGVKVSADLSLAHVWISVIGGPDDIDKNMVCLRGAAGFIRAELGRRLRVKRIPELRFHYDDSSVKGARIDSILKRLKDSGDEKHDAEDQ
jgi:ribosome-binding factor A